MSEEKYLTAKEAMQEIRTRTGQAVSKYSFYSWVKDGLLKQRRLGKRKILIAVSDLNIFLSDFDQTSKLLASEP